MITLRRSDERGHFDHGWLDTYHTFSFGDYYDPRQMGFRSLRVINEDVVQPGGGFPTHPHRDMEILTFVLEGALAHRDSMGNGSVIRPGDVQRMTAGSGVTHSEANDSRTEPVHLMQIWILPRERGLTPGYEQTTFPPAEMQDRWRLIASPDGVDGTVTIHQDVRLHAARVAPGRTLDFAFAPGRHGWLQVARGAVTAGSLELRHGDGIAISEESALSLVAREQSDLLLFDLA